MGKGTSRGKRKTYSLGVSLLKAGSIFFFKLVAFIFTLKS